MCVWGGGGGGKLICVINKIKCMVAECLLRGLSQSQLLCERIEFKDNGQAQDESTVPTVKDALIPAGPRFHDKLTRSQQKQRTVYLFNSTVPCKRGILPWSSVSALLSEKDSEELKADF